MIALPELNKVLWAGVVIRVPTVVGGFIYAQAGANPSPSFVVHS